MGHMLHATAQTSRAWALLSSAQPTTANATYLHTLLQHNPNQNLVNLVCRGFQIGFGIHPGPLTSTHVRKARTALSNPTACRTQILKDVELGNILGPFLHPPFQQFHCSPIGAHNKTDESIRLILDLSSPRGSAIKGINPE